VDFSSPLSTLSKHWCDYALVVFAFFAAFALPALVRVVEIDMELLYDMEVAGVGGCGVG